MLSDNIIEGNILISLTSGLLIVSDLLIYSPLFSWKDISPLISFFKRLIYSDDHGNYFIKNSNSDSSQYSHINFGLIRMGSGSGKTKKFDNSSDPGRDVDRIGSDREGAIFNNFFLDDLKLSFFLCFSVLVSNLESLVSTGTLELTMFSELILNLHDF